MTSQTQDLASAMIKAIQSAPSVWNACTSEPNSVLRWIECHPALGSWVQGIGTFFAIVAAVYIPIRSQKILERLRRREYRTRLHHLLDAIEKYANQLEYCARILHQVILNKVEREDAKEYFASTVADLRSSIDAFDAANSDELLGHQTHWQMPVVRRELKEKATAAIHAVQDALNVGRDPRSKEVEETRIVAAHQNAVDFLFAIDTVRQRMLGVSLRDQIDIWVRGKTGRLKFHWTKLCMKVARWKLKHLRSPH